MSSLVGGVKYRQMCANSHQTHGNKVSKLTEVWCSLMCSRQLCADVETSLGFQMVTGQGLLTSTHVFVYSCFFKV